MISVFLDALRTGTRQFLLISPLLVHVVLLFFAAKDIKAVKDFICRQKAVGGGDLPEDVLAAMNAVADWDDWNARARFVVLIGDAPAHGKECTDDPSDKYPNGPPHNLTVQQVLV